MQKGSVSWAGHDWRLQGLFLGISNVCVKWKDTEFERQVRSESLKRKFESSWLAAMQATVGNRSAAEGALLDQPRSRQTPPESADSLLNSHVEITGDFDFKDHNDGNHFLECEIDSRVVARTYLERKNKEALQVKCSWKRNKPMPKSSQWIPTSCIVAVKITWACRGKVCSHMWAQFSLLFLFFLFLFALRLATFLSAFTQQLLPLPVRFSWEESGPNFVLGY